MFSFSTTSSTKRDASCEFQLMDNLGLDQPIKLGKSSKIPKITDELVFNPSRGIPQILKQYPKLTRSIRKRDAKFNESLKKNKHSSKTAKSLRVDHECENLQHILQFYQLWCHGFFPRANFADCISMLRAYKSPRLKLYRRELLDNEIRKEKIAQGLIVEEDEPNPLDFAEDDLYGPPPQEQEQTNEASDDDDWGFMNVNKANTNGLFVGEEDNQNDPAPESETQKTSNPEEDFPDSIPDHQIEARDPFSDDEHEAELEAMREMGM